MVTNYVQKHCHKNIVATHCCKTLSQLQNIDITLQKRLTHTTTPLIKDWGTQITTDKFKPLVGKTEKVSFNSGFESRDTVRRADLLRKSVLSRRGGVFERSLTIGYSTDKWTMEDRVVKTWAKLTGSGVNGKVREVGRRVSWHRVVANTCKFVLDAIING